MNSGNKLILKNTLFLYIRMILIMGANLFTYRLVLQALGIEDFGIYQVVGGLVLLFTIINSALSSGSSRFITFSLGSKNNLGDTFNASFRIHFIMAIIIFILLETIGLWYINNHLVIPNGRMIAVNWIYQFSIITCILGLIQVPYSALIIAHERMDIYAYVGVAEALFKLLLVTFLFLVKGFDKLILYGVLICIWSVLLQLYYRYYCQLNYPESKISSIKDKSILKKMLKFSYWNIIGSFTIQGNTQGVNLLINSFFGVIYNSSFGLANQIKGILEQFIQNFMTAVNPQITKSYALNDFSRVKILMYNTSKLGFILYTAIALPLLFEANYVLSLWLGIVPDKSSLFLQLIIIICLVRSFTRPVLTAVHATGNIKLLNLLSGGFSVIITLPFTYLAFEFGFPIHYTFYITIFTSCVCNYIELYVLERNNKFFNRWKYILEVYLPCTISLIPLIIMHTIIQTYIEASFLRFLLIFSLNITVLGIITYLFLIDKNTRGQVNRQFHKRWILLASNK